ncbi:MAG: glucosaminidase domain-containing protein [Phascolarctobacterium sp.]|nr:glucosaminidase domain-containing protein [Phascolarctobacterium sp.]
MLFKKILAVLVLTGCLFLNTANASPSPGDVSNTPKPNTAVHVGSEPVPAVRRNPAQQAQQKIKAQPAQQAKPQAPAQPAKAPTPAQSAQAVKPQAPAQPAKAPTPAQPAQAAKPQASAQITKPQPVQPPAPAKAAPSLPKQVQSGETNAGTVKEPPKVQQPEKALDKGRVAEPHKKTPGTNVPAEPDTSLKDIVLGDKDIHLENPEAKVIEVDKKGRPVKSKDTKGKKGKKGKKGGRKKPRGPVYYGGIRLPDEYWNISIFGPPVATKDQAATLILQNNPTAQLACTVPALVDIYWEEAASEGVRPDLALCQAIIETGFFKYGGDVRHNQNNFCGLGVTGGGKKGASFKSPKIGVRAHIQHLLAYTLKRLPSKPIVDPRYKVAHNIRLERGIVDTWYGLNGNWATGSQYCEKIMAIYQRMLSTKPDAKLIADAMKGKPLKGKKKKGRR